MAKKVCEICGERPATVPVRIALGWANGWTDEPQIVKDCKAENHPFKERNLDPTMHGFDHLVWCNICGYEYHYDSSG